MLHFRAGMRAFRIPFFQAAVTTALLTPAFLSGYSVAPRPGFVKPAAFDSAAVPPPSQSESGVYFLLSDEQEEIASQSHYRHYARKAINATGLPQISQISITYDTSYQKLDFHRVTLWRRGAPQELLSRLAPTRLRREGDWEWGMLDGQTTILFSLEDVRVDDIVEYEYTLRGDNPVFRGKGAGSNLLRYSEVVDKVRLRLLYPPGRNLQVSRRAGAGPFVSGLENGRMCLAWDLSKVPALAMDEDVPAWYDPYSRIQWSEYSDWGEVVNWALPLYELDKPLSPELLRVAAGLKGLEPGERIRRALRLVQDDIRYLGLEMGMSSHKPAHPNVVFARRFGDCKDKALLFCALLRETGLESAPVLVNSWNRRQVADYQPAPNAFNHVIARVRLPDGFYYFDPTLSHQRGDPLKNQTLPFGKGLAIVQGNFDFDDILMRDAERSRIEISQVFRLSRWEGECSLDVTSEYYGAEAEALRAQFAMSNRDKLAKEYLNYYANYYSHIRSRGEIISRDDATTNHITLIENYALDSLCARDEEGKLACSFYPQEIANCVRIPEERIRSSPYALAYPKNVSEDIEVNLPSALSFPRDREKISNPDFIFDWNERGSGRVLRMSYNYSSLEDNVSPEHYAAYLQAIDKIHSNLGAVIFPGAGSSMGLANFNFLLFFYCAVCLAVAVWICRKVMRMKILEPTQPLPWMEPRPIGGPLVLMGFGLVVQPFVRLYVMKSFLELFNTTTWNALTVPGHQSYNPVWLPLMLVEIFGSTVILCASLALWPLFFERQRLFPKAFMLFAGFGIAIGLADALGMMLLPESLHGGSRPKEIGTWIRDSIIALAWMGYLLKSSRARETFMLPLKEGSRPPAQVAEEQGQSTELPAEMEIPPEDAEAAKRMRLAKELLAESDSGRKLRKGQIVTLGIGLAVVVLAFMYGALPGIGAVSIYGSLISGIYLSKPKRRSR
jgi:transglutaminase-like putative cysteine protease